MTWRRTRVAPDGTHHTLDGQPLYSARFRDVLKFHAPGLAPAVGDDGAMHIDLQGLPAYSARFARTFGFYEGRAAVQATEGWLHILPNGESLYKRRFDWCGNYQGDRCTVRDREGRYRHLLPDGANAYRTNWKYAGDFRDGIAVVQRDDGLHSHIDADGQLVHGQWFVDLDVFHKGLARARDAQGWTHVDREGRPIYTWRFASVEPFYNGQARVERFDGGLQIIDEAGAPTAHLRRGQPGPELEDGRLGGWELGDVVHRGSHGAVYASGPDAVIKSTSDLSGWQRELELLRALEGLGVPRILDAFTRSGTGYLVLERFAGQPLGKRNQTRPRSVQEAVSTVCAVLQPIARLHSMDWVHTDIHPSNALERGPNVVVLDFAYAIHVGASGAWSGEVHWGRWEFVPPEQFEGFRTLDATADTYAACALLAYLVNGLGPFQVSVADLRPAGWAAVRQAFRALRPTPELGQLRGDLRAIVARGLDIDRSRRFQHAGELLSDLEAFLA